MDNLPEDRFKELNWLFDVFIPSVIGIILILGLIARAINNG